LPWKCWKNRCPAGCLRRRLKGNVTGSISNSQI